MNQLNVSIQQSIVALGARGWSQRRIARELQLDRATVARYAKREDSKSASKLAHGSGDDAVAKPANNPALGLRPGPPSRCAPLG